MIIKKLIFPIYILISKILSLFNSNFLYSKFLVRFYFAKILLRTYNFFFFSKLSRCFYITRSDKFEQYSEAYDIIAHLLKKRKIKKILEIGIGGHTKDYQGGMSLLALSEFFSDAEVYGADIIDKKFLNIGKIHTIELDQSNKSELIKVGKKIGPFDLIIDDGSHFANHQRISFENLFPYLQNNGYYIIEDMYGNYEKALNGDPDLSIKKNNISYFANNVHAVNSFVLYNKKYQKLKNLVHIDKIFFLNKMIILQKKIKNHKIMKKSFLTRNLKQYSAKKNKKGFLEYK